MSLFKDLLEYVELNPQIDPSLNEAFMTGMYDFINMKMILSGETLKSLLAKLNGQNLPQLSAEIEGGLPTMTILSDKAGCLQQISQIIATFGSVVDEIMSVTTSNRTLVFQILKPSNIRDYIDGSNRIVDCITDYSAIVADIQLWKKKRFNDDVDRLIGITQDEQVGGAQHIFAYVIVNKSVL